MGPQSSSGNVSGGNGLGSADSQGTHQLNFQNQNGFGNHKQFTMSTQHGLFPKIMNLRVENQTVPNSAHSNGHQNQMQ